MITADGGWRGGQAIELKAAADKALAAGCAERRARHRAEAHRQARRHAARSATCGGTTSSRDRPPPASPSGWTPSTRCSCCTPPAPPASPRAFSTATGGYLLRRQAHHAVGLRSARRRRVLVHRGCRLGHRAQLRRLRTARRGCDRAHVRGRADVAGRRALLEELPEPRRHGVLHRADRDPRAHEARRRAAARSTTCRGCACSAASASRSIRKPGCGITA